MTCRSSFGLLSALIMALLAICLVAGCTPPAAKSNPEDVAERYLKACRDDEPIMARSLSLTRYSPTVIEYSLQTGREPQKEQGSLDAFKEGYMQQLRDLNKLRALYPRKGESFTVDRDILALQQKINEIRNRFPLIYEVQKAGRLSEALGNNMISGLAGHYRIELVDFPVKGKIWIFREENLKSGVFRLHLVRMKINEQDNLWKVYDLVDPEGVPMLERRDAGLPPGYISLDEMLTEIEP